jgi:hypothetical protein
MVNSEQISAPEVVGKELFVMTYMITSSVLTLVNKYLYAKYHFKSPLNLLFMQCLCNVIICASMISWKTFVNPRAFDQYKKYGIIIPSFS